MAECTEIYYRGVKIVYTNVEDCSGDQAIPVFKKVLEVAKNYDSKSMLSLVNAQNTRFSSALLSTIKEVVKQNNPKVKATAVFGLNALSTMMANSIISVTGRQMKLFKTQTEAQDWLHEYELKTRSAAV